MPVVMGSAAGLRQFWVSVPTLKCGQFDTHSFRQIEKKSIVPNTGTM